MPDSPRLKETHRTHLCDLLDTRGWDAATVVRAARTPLDALNSAQARAWRTKLTNATTGTPQATPRPTPEVAPPVHHRTTQAPAAPDSVGEAEPEGAGDTGFHPAWPGGVVCAD